MPGLGAVEVGQELDAVRRKIRRACRRMDGLRGDSTVDRIIDVVLAPLVMDCMNGVHETIDEAAKAAGDDLLSVFSRPPRLTPESRG